MNTNPHIALARILARQLYRGLSSASALDFTNTFDRDDFNRLDDHARALARALSRDLSLNPDLNLDRALAGARTLLLSLSNVSAIDHASALIKEVELAREWAASGAEPRRAALRLVALTTRVLPRGEQARYAEEMQAELWDQAEAGAGRYQQFAYAARALSRSWQLRTELKTPHRRKATT